MKRKIGRNSAIEKNRGNAIQKDNCMRKGKWNRKRNKLTFKGKGEKENDIRNVESRI